MKGKNDPTTFLPLNTKIGGPAKCVKDKENICLTTDQARHINKKMQLEGIVNVDSIKQEIEGDKLSKNNTDDEAEVSPYHSIIINSLDWENLIASHMEQWSILSNIVHYVKYDRNHRDFGDLDVKAADQKNNRKIYDRLKEEDRQVLELDFGNNPEKLRGEYLDMYEGV